MGNGANTFKELQNSRKEMSYLEYYRPKRKQMSLQSAAVFFIGLYILMLFLFEDSKQYFMIANLVFAGMVAISLFTLRNLQFDLLRTEKFLIAYMCLTGVSVLWAWDIKATISDTTRQILFFIMWYSIVSILRRDERFIKIVLKWIMLAGCVLTGYLLLHYGVGAFIASIFSSVRIGEDIVQLNKLGMYAATVIIIAVNFFLHTRKVSYIGVILINFIAMAGSSSKRAYLMVVLCIVISVLFSIHSRNALNRFFKVIVWLCILGIAGYYLLRMEVFSGIANRFLELFDTVDNRRNDFSRTRFLMYGWESFKQNPILGIGSGNSHKVTLQAMGWATYLHNNYLEQAVNLGIIGLTIYYGIYISLLRSYIPKLKEHNMISNTIIVLLISQLISDIAATSYNVKFTYVLFALAIAYLKREKDIAIRE